MFVVNTKEELNDLPVGVVVQSYSDTIACKASDDLGVVFGDDRVFPWEILTLPVTVLYLPGRDLFREAIDEAVTSMYHPEFGSKWAEDGELTIMMREAQNIAWHFGFEDCLEWVGPDVDPYGNRPHSPYQEAN